MVRGLKKTIPLSYGNKYSAATFNDGTYIMGSIFDINLVNKNAIVEEVEKYQNKGYRVLVLAKGQKEIDGRTYKERVTPIALLVLREEFKEEANMKGDNETQNKKIKIK